MMKVVLNYRVNSHINKILKGRNMRQVKVRMIEGMKTDLDKKCKEENISINSYIIGLIAEDLCKPSEEDKSREAMTREQSEFYRVVKLVEGIHQSQLELAKFLSHIQGEEFDNGRFFDY